MFHWFKKHTEDGSEKPDPRPQAIPLKSVLTLQQQLERFSRAADLAQAAQKIGIDTFEEADDFGPETVTSDILDGRTAHEMMEDDEMHVPSRVDEIEHGSVHGIPPERMQAAEDRHRATQNKLKEKALKKANDVLESKPEA